MHGPEKKDVSVLDFRELSPSVALLEQTAMGLL